MSSDSNSHSDTGLEHRQNFESLPFNNLQFDPPVYPSFASAFYQLPLHPLTTSSTSLISSTTPSNISLTNPHQYRETPTIPSPTSTTSHQSSTSFSSLPPLVPNSDISDTLNQDLVTGFSTLSLTEPPVYTSSTENPPSYDFPRTNEWILWRIRELERESTIVVIQLRDLRDSAIQQLSDDIDTQIHNHLERYRESIRYLEGLIIN